MNQNPQSPQITKRVWGRIDVEGYEAFKDVKLYPGGARAWHWEETGTRHSPGIQSADVAELLEYGATVVVLTTGVLGRLKVPSETLNVLQTQGVTVHVKRTPEAVRLYNELRETVPVGALIHSTC